MEKAQGSMEMLLLIGGVMVVVLVVIIVIFNFEAITEGQVGDVFQVFRDMLKGL